MNKQYAQGGILAWFVHNPVAANLLMFSLLILGLFTAWDIRTEAFPAFPAKRVTIAIEFLGGSPKEVEEGVAVKVEESLRGMPGIAEISSLISSSGAEITVTAKSGYNLQALRDDIKLRVDSISSFPSQAERAVITREEEERQVLTVEVYGDVNHRTLKETARRIRNELLSIPEVNKVDTHGERTYAINIDVNHLALRQYQLSFDDVAEAVKNNSINLSIGELRSDSSRISIRSEQQRYYGEDFKSIVVRAQSNGGTVYLGDVANIQDGYDENWVFSRFNGVPSISLPVRLLGQDSITSSADAVKDRLAEIRGSSWMPEEVRINTWNDESKIIRDRLALMGSNALTGMILVAITLALFLNVQVAAWVCLGIPVAFAGTFVFMGPQVLNLSLNELTTFGFIVVLGIVVDDAIVIAESIYSEKGRVGKHSSNDLDTTIRGASRVAVPATFGVLTTVAAFFPLVFIQSEFGEAFGAIALIVIVALLFSLVESKLILPAHLARLDVYKSPRNPLSRHWKRLQCSVEHCLISFVDYYYLPFLAKVIRRRYTVFGLFIALLVLVIGLVPAGIVGAAFFPNIEGDVVELDLKLKKGLGFSQLDLASRRIEAAAIETNKQLKDHYNLDRDAIPFVYAFGTGDESAQIYAQALSSEYRSFNLQELVSRWRTNIGELPGVESLDIYSMGPEGSDAEIEIHLTAADEKTLAEVTQLLKQRLAQYSGVSDVKSSHQDGHVELLLNLRKEATAQGLSYASVTQQLRDAIYGVEAQRLQRGRDEVKVRVRYPQAERDHITDLNKIRIKTGSGATVPLGMVADLVREDTHASISRVDGLRVSEVTARIDDSGVDAADIMDDLEDGFFKNIQQQYPDVSVYVSGDALEESRATRSLLLGFLLALILIYALLAIPLKSYSEPLVIMAAIPFGMIGAIIGHLLVGIPMSLLSFFGVLALSGVVVNDSLILTSRYNQMLTEGLTFDEAIMKAGSSRFRAILLTSLTTFIGLAPLLIERSAQAQFLIPMAVSLAFGILFATVITLVIVPILLGVNRDINLAFSNSRINLA
ncbi:MAG: efflux RND transporter permease subunit [Cellvibrionaceae bacterium]|nr:efflux RND transporter permease subunit [Cellvibrionaceae bacterium]